MMATDDLAKRAPGPPMEFWQGHARSFRHDPLGFLLSAARDFGPVVRLRLGPLTYHLVSDPARITAVLQDRPKIYVRDTRSSRNTRLVTGESLLNAEGEAWRRHRRLAQPIFHQQRLAHFAVLIGSAVDSVRSQWERAASTGQPIDLTAAMNRLAFIAVGRCLFGAELGSEAAKVEAALPVLLRELFTRTSQVFSVPVWMPAARNRRFKAALGEIDQLVNRIIADRRHERDERADLLGLLLRARDDDGSTLSDEELRNHVVTFLLAGHETTASLMTWALGLVATHPPIQAKIVEELRAASSDRVVWGDLETLALWPQLNASLQETLRLYPSIWIAERRVTTADHLGGFALPEGSSVIVSPYVTQRLPNLWPEPDEFRPQRFLDASPASGLLRGYFPFGAGPHTCIGQHFALMEAKIIVARLLERFHFEPAEDLPPPVADITLRPSGPVRVRVSVRKSV